MKFRFLLPVISIFSLFSCDSDPQPLTYRYDVCDCHDSTIVQNNISRFPFSDSIIAVAYQYDTYDYQSAARVGLDTNGRFIDSTMVRIDTLNSIELKQLEKVVFNRYEVCEGDYDEEKEPTDCGYFPHHCIVFYKNDRVVAYLETCFLCTDLRAWPDSVFGSMCGDFYDDMRYFYKSAGFAEDALELETCPGYLPDTIEIWKGHYE